jgi:hypothetical protein
MSDRPICDCIEQLNGYWIQTCDCANTGNLASAQSWCVEANLAKKHSGMVLDNLVTCGCGDSYPAQSYGAGWIHAIGNCPNCESAK